MSPYPHWRKGTKGLSLPAKRCAAFFAESRMQVGGPAEMHRKCGVGLQQCETALAVSSQCR
jgi:hypothetical protein